jgi:hypothetical protein
VGKAPIHKRVARNDIWISSDTCSSIESLTKMYLTVMSLLAYPVTLFFFFLIPYSIKGHLPASVSVRFLGGGGGPAPSQPLKSSESALSRTAIYFFSPVPTSRLPWNRAGSFFFFFFLEYSHLRASVRAESVGKSTFQLPGNCTSK